MTSPRSAYGGGHYSAVFPETPIYDSLVAERGTPQIAPIRVPAAYEAPVGHVPALPGTVPALPAPPVQPSYGYPQAPIPQHAPPQQAPAPHFPAQAPPPRGYPGPQRPMAPNPAGFESMRPAAPRPAPAPYQQQYPDQQYRAY
ncbi:MULTISPECIES: DUF6643 family protein [unclassified Streptomyces]|uniref:DUF6643 family protein n=1 Tax=unclassified Streptomyces TaxID=2593676 RepID=UPI0019050B5E|nr:DUF6643 family protein [Streptomyces sp. HSG2]